MPLKVDHVRSLVAFPFLVFGEGVSQRLESTASGRVIGFSGITRRLPISIKLKHDSFLACQRDRQIIKFKHTHLIESFIRAVKLLPARPSFKLNVRVPFTFASGSKTSRFLRRYFFIFERLCIAGTEITATVSTIESQKKDSTHRGIQNVRSRIKCKLLYTEASTVLTRGVRA